jgi:CheY-like chemotaxis protein
MGERPTILVVDDDVSLQELIADTLEGEYEVVCASDGREGITKAEQFQPAIILMDVFMPDMNGPEAVRQLGQNAATCNIPVLMLTANDKDAAALDDVKHEPNMAGILSKPFHPKEVRESIRSHLESW